MFFLQKPSQETITQLLVQQNRLPLNYPEVGATLTDPPAGYNVDHNQVLLGKGSETWQLAKEALQSWQHFNIAWLKLVPSTVPVEEGQVVAVLTKVLGAFWSLTPCRLVYVREEEDEQSSRFGFAWGALPGHAAKGEERFLVEWNYKTDEVRYDVLAFSLPDHWLAHLGYYYVRYLQQKFGRDTKQAMVETIQKKLTSARGAVNVASS